MTRRERVIAAVNHIETDSVPYNISLTKQEHDKVATYLDDPEFVGKAGNHLEMAYYNGFLEETEPGSGYWRDDFGVLWNRNGADKDIGVIEGFVIHEPSLDAYIFPEIDENRIIKRYESELIALSGGLFQSIHLNVSREHLGHSSTGISPLELFVLFLVHPYAGSTLASFISLSKLHLEQRYLKYSGGSPNGISSPIRSS